MENDFRQVFYKVYNSKFKHDPFHSIEKEIKKEWKYFDFKIFPLIREFSNTASVLEIGCGRGTLLEYLREKNFTNVIGIDISKEQVDLALSRGLNAVESDVIYFLSNSKSNYDIIFAIDIVEHFDKVELVELFNTLYYKLNYNGVLIIQTPNGHAMFPGRIIYGDLTHLTIFTPGSLSQILKLANFKKIAFYERGPVMKNLKGVIRTILWTIQKFIYNILLIIYCGRGENILSQNFICRAEK
ncbi:MAG: class I SAM-dependent methyltransferase [Ignavibacterium sp.]|nr:class I SAM-dependent methyltransferase [Ignavibacterium sp.]